METPSSGSSTRSNKSRYAGWDNNVLFLCWGINSNSVWIWMFFSLFEMSDVQRTQPGYRCHLHRSHFCRVRSDSGDQRQGVSHRRYDFDHVTHYHSNCCSLVFMSSHCLASHSRQTGGRRDDARHTVWLHSALGWHKCHPEEEPDSALWNGLWLQGKTRGCGGVKSGVTTNENDPKGRHCLFLIVFFFFFLISPDHTLHLHPLHDHQPGGVPVVGLGDGEVSQRTASQTLCLYQEEWRLVRLVQRVSTTQKGFPGHRRPLTPPLSDSPQLKYTKI